MNYFDKKRIEAAIKTDIEYVNEFENVELFIEANFQQFLRNGEYDDNSVDLAYNYRMLKAIAADENFMQKLHFVLSKYVRSKVAK